MSSLNPFPEMGQLRWGLLVICALLHSTYSNPVNFTEQVNLQKQSREMFYHAYRGYLDYAFPADELKPLSCTPRSRLLENRGHLDDTLGNYLLTLVDGLDTLAVMGDWEEFGKGIQLIIDNLTLNSNVVVSVFEATIRVLGGLLSTHFIATTNKEKLGFEYKGDLLGAARELADRMLPAFDTPTGLPYGRVNLRSGVPR